MQVVELANDAGQVADAVAVRVAVGFGIDLVNDFVFEVHGILRVMVAAWCGIAGWCATRTDKPLEKGFFAKGYK